MTHEPTPVGQSAATAGQTQAPREPAPVDPGGGRVEQPVEGPTPVGKSVSEAPSKTHDAPSARQLQQDVSNLALLARAAIGQGFETMPADPRMVANVCALAQRSASSLQATSGSEEAARQAGRQEAAEAFAEERLRLLGRIRELEELIAQTTTEPAPDSDGPQQSFSGPGQRRE